MNIPEGFKLVPVDPTENMVIHGFESTPNECFTDYKVWDAYQEMSGCQQAAFRAKLCWAAMLAAAPTPPQPIYDEAAETQLARFSYDADPNLTASWSDFKYGWLACAQSRAKAGEDE